MGRDCLFRAHWKILSDRIPESVRDAFEILLENRDLDTKQLRELKDLSTPSMRGWRKRPSHGQAHGR
jgi:hypothetical protein